MKVEKFTVQACCGKTSVIFKIDQPVGLNHVNQLVNLGFIERKHFTEAGIIYIDNSDFIITAPLGSNKLQVKCKHSKCSDEKFEVIEIMLQQIG